MFERLSERLERSFKILKGQGKITEINVAETLKDVRKALLDADVNYKVAKDITDKIKDEALGQKIMIAMRTTARTTQKPIFMPLKKWGAVAPRFAAKSAAL